MDQYDVTIIGGGSAGLVLAVAGAKLGKTVALVEKHRLGGDCLWTGCVPSKAILKAAKVANYVKEAGRFGIRVDDAQVDFDQVMAHVTSAQEAIKSEHDNPERFREMGVDVIFGEGQFDGTGKFVVKDREEAQMRSLTSKKFVIATGSRPAIPAIPGLESGGYLHSENVWDLKELPSRLLVIGAGPIGIELGQAFHRLGSEVTIVQRGNRILPKEDNEVSERMLNYLREEGITILLNTCPVEVGNREQASVDQNRCDDPPSGRCSVRLETAGEDRSLEVDQILIAVGRRPNVEGLGLDTAGVEVERSGICVNKRLRTTANNIFAAGDVVGHYLFTHVAAFQAAQIVRNMFFPGSSAIDYSVVPWTTFCDPEVARCGMTEAEARAKHGKIDVFSVDLRDVDRAVSDGETRGFVKVIATRWTGKILGVHLVCPGAGEVIHEFVLAMKEGIPLRKLSGMIHVYPTYSSIVWRVAGKWLAEGKLVQTLRNVVSAARRNKIETSK
ncbi:MAG: mercuric reductase [Candidatus Poribacteria bacterium]|nr:mercuric reductase [Candidatus Poribacteria bacterium]